MKTPIVQTVLLDKPFMVAGKIFTGDYAKSPDYVNEIKAELQKENVPFEQYKVLGVYYDNPQEKKAHELKSFQGAFLQDAESALPSSLDKLFLKGRYLYVKMDGDPMKAIYEGYDALFKHIQQNSLTLKSSAGYQVTSFDNGNMTTEIYMELK